MNQRAFLKMDGVAGRSAVPGHAGEIDIYRLGFVSSSTPKNSMPEFKFFKTLDSTSPALMSRVQYGGVIKKALVTIEKMEADKVIHSYRIEMADITVTGYNTVSLNYPVRDPGGDGPIEPSEVSQIYLDEIRLNIGKLIYPNVFSMIGANILSMMGISDDWIKK